MAAAQGAVRYHQNGQTVTFQVEGRGTIPQSLPLRHSSEYFISNGTTLLRIDLHACTYMDSTFVGTLLFLKKELEKKGRGTVQLIAPSPACDRILQQMGLEELFPGQHAAGDLPTTWTELPCASGDSGALRSNITEAHRELASLPGSAGEQFQAVMRCLTQNDRTPPPPPPPTPAE